MTTSSGVAGAAVDSVPVVALRNVSKTFGGAHALRAVSLTVLPGEVHGLLGQNGSGKSTLIKILSGFHAPEPGGTLEVNGVRVTLPLQPGQFRALGLSFVHQDLGLIPSLSVTENLRIGELAGTRRWHISWARERRRAAELFRRYGLDLDPEATVAEIGAIDRALLGIVRAVEEMRAHRQTAGGGRGLLVLDEPTSFLPRAGAERLFALVREIAAGGESVLFVSHKLDEVREITDRVTVLRDGRLIGTARTAELSEAQLVEMIIGRQLAALAPPEHRPPDGAVDVAVDGLAGGPLRELSLALHAGEVLGITGLLGAGFEQLPYLLFGARPAAAGVLTLRGRRHALDIMTPREAVALGLALVPADRQNDGSIGTLSVADNISMQVIKGYVRRLRLDRQRLRRDAQALLRAYEVRPPDPDLAYQSLSGGNQQKVLLAKWLRTEPALLHEPTQGVDVGARRQIFELIRAAARRGTAVICASADYEQLAAICDRVLIVARGRVVRELSGGELNAERIAEQCLTGVSLEGAPQTRALAMDESVAVPRETRT